MPTTTISPIAALRRLRRAAWQLTGHIDLCDAVTDLVEPLGVLEHTWHRLCRAHESYTKRQTADTWADLSNALAAFDAALVPLFGPSGWESPRGEPSSAPGPRNDGEPSGRGRYAR